MLDELLERGFGGEANINEKLWVSSPCQANTLPVRRKGTFSKDGRVAFCNC